MLRRIWKIGRDFIYGPPVPVDERTVELLNDPDREFEQCGNCRFRSTMVDRCKRLAGPYYNTPVNIDFACSLFEPKADLDVDKQRGIQKLRLTKPRGGVTPKGYLARRMELHEFTTPGTMPQRYERRGCLTCYYNPDRADGIGYEGCRFPGEVYDLNPIDGGKFCPSWTKGGE